MTAPIHSRVLIKLSGEALAGESGFGANSAALQRFAAEFAELHAMGIQVAIVIGGGNYLRGKNNTEAVIDRVTADKMAMLFTVANGLAFRAALKDAGVDVALFSTVPVPGFVDQYDSEKAKQAMQAGKMLILSGGVAPYLSTDTCASLRAIEIEADIILKASTVDGVYSADPKLDPSAERYEQLSFCEALDKKLRVMDLPAMCLCRDHDMPIRVFDMNQEQVFKRLAQGEAVGTLISKSLTV